MPPRGRNCYFEAVRSLGRNAPLVKGETTEKKGLLLLAAVLVGGLRSGALNAPRRFARSTHRAAGPLLTGAHNFPVLPCRPRTVEQFFCGGVAQLLRLLNGGARAHVSIKKALGCPDKNAKRFIACRLSRWLHYEN